MKRRGPDKAKRAKRGALWPWLFEAMDSATDECVLWPFSVRATQYGQIRCGTKNQMAHRVVCYTTHGSPPQDKGFAAHSCGNKLCCNPRHLRWASPKENSADMVRHGTAIRGSKVWVSKLNEDSVREIRASTAPYAELSFRFGVKSSQIAAIRGRRAWAWVI